MIQFFAESITFPDIHQPKITAWIRQVISSHQKNPGVINIIFCNDEKLLKINRMFLQHDYFTDIITFDESTIAALSGDIYISIDTVASNAILMNIPFEKELNRVIIHGILHLCGFKDKTPEESKKMRLLEDNALSFLT